MHLHPATMAAQPKLLQALLFLLLLSFTAVAAAQLEESEAPPPRPPPPPSTTPPNLTLHNMCPYTIWPLITPNSGLPSLLPSDSDDENSFTHLANGALLTLPFPAGQAWSGRVVARTGCVSVRITAVGPYASDPDSELFAATRCATGDPPEPVTVAQVSVGGADGIAAYSVSLVDGFNVPLVVTPHGSFVSGSGGGCPTLGCAADLEAVCPEDAKAPGGGCRAEDEGIRELFKRRCPDARTTPTDVEVTPQRCLSPRELRIVFCPDAGGN